VAVGVGRFSRRGKPIQNALSSAVRETHRRIFPFHIVTIYTVRLNIVETNFLCRTLIATSTAARMIQGFSAVYGSEGLHTQADAPLYPKRYENVLEDARPKNSCSYIFPLGFFLREIWRLVNISSSVLQHMRLTFTTMLGYGTSISNGLRNKHRAFDSR